MFRIIAFIALLALIQPLRAETATVEGSAGSASDDVTVTIVVDSDRDGLTDAEEALLGTDPGNSDTDGDTLPDGYEDRKKNCRLDTSTKTGCGVARVGMGIRHAALCSLTAW